MVLRSVWLGQRHRSFNSILIFHHAGYHANTAHDTPPAQPMLPFKPTQQMFSSHAHVIVAAEFLLWRHIFSAASAQFLACSGHWLDYHPMDNFFVPYQKKAPRSKWGYAPNEQGICLFKQTTKNFLWNLLRWLGCKFGDCHNVFAC